MAVSEVYQRKGGSCLGAVGTEMLGSPQGNDESRGETASSG